MSWDPSGYGSHLETGVTAPSTTWYLAEGSTSGPFALFYLMHRETGWKLSPEPTRSERFTGLTPAQSTTFKVLEKWFLLRKADLIVEERQK